MIGDAWRPFGPPLYFGDQNERIEGFRGRNNKILVDIVYVPAFETYVVLHVVRHVNLFARGRAIVSTFNLEGEYLASDNAWSADTEHSAGGGLAADSAGNVYINGVAGFGDYYSTYYGWSDLFITRTNWNLAPVWKKRFGLTGYPAANEARCMVPMPDGGFMLAAQSALLPDQQRRVRLVKVDPGGQLVWEKLIGDSTKVQYIEDLVATSDGSYMATLQSYGSPSLVTDPGWNLQVVKFDATGTEKWVRNYWRPFNWGKNRTLVTPDGGFLITTVKQLTPTGFVKAAMLRLDAEGDSLWNSHYTFALISEPFAVIQTSDGGYLLAGEAKNNSGPNGIFFLKKTDDAGTLDWYKIFFNNDHRFQQLCETTDGSIVATGYVQLDVSTPTFAHALLGARLPSRPWRRAVRSGPTARREPGGRRAGPPR